MRTLFANVRHTEILDAPGSESLQVTRGVAVLVDEPPHHLHVLLRHRLLRQLRGFQRIGWLVKEGLEAKHLTIADLKENPDRLIERNPAPPAAETDMAQRGDAISRVAPILDHQVPLVELLVDLPKVATDACSAADGLTQNPTHEHGVRVDLLIRKPALASVPPSEHAPGELHVLLRHRLHRKPCGFEGFLTLLATFERPRDDVWVMRLAKGIHVPGVPRLERGLNDFHVPLRHRLRSISRRLPGSIVSVSRERRFRMRRFVLVVVAAIALALALPAGAGARTIWRCEVPQQDGTTITVDFVSAADAAKYGITTANNHAGKTFNRNFGEECTVVSG
jgi:hypothetical protein